MMRRVEQEPGHARERALSKGCAANVRSRRWRVCLPLRHVVTALVAFTPAIAGARPAPYDYCRSRGALPGGERLGFKGVVRELEAAGRCLSEDRSAPVEAGCVDVVTIVPIGCDGARAVPGVTVRVMADADGAELEATSGADGHARVCELAPGAYRVSAGGPDGRVDVGEPGARVVLAASRQGSPVRARVELLEVEPGAPYQVGSALELHGWAIRGPEVDDDLDAELDPGKTYHVTAFRDDSGLWWADACGTGPVAEAAPPPRSRGCARCDAGDRAAPPPWWIVILAGVWLVARRRVS
jgi:hypothetical protein